MPVQKWEKAKSQDWLLPEVSTLAFGSVLCAFARGVGASEDEPVLLVLDGAGWHVSKTLRVPPGMPGIILVFLPPYSPELQPAEHLWALTDAPLKNQHFTSLADLEARLAERCAELERLPQLIQAHTRFHWWPFS